MNTTSIPIQGYKQAIRYLRTRGIKIIVNAPHNSPHKWNSKFGPNMRVMDEYIMPTCQLVATAGHCGSRVCDRRRMKTLVKFLARQLKSQNTY